MEQHQQQHPLADHVVPRPTPTFGSPMTSAHSSNNHHQPFLAHLDHMRTDHIAHTPVANYPMSGQAIFYMGLLALQFGVQPILTRRFTPRKVTKSTIILAQEMCKLFLAGMMLYLTTMPGSGETMASVMEGWSVTNWIEVAGVPAALYAIQNMAALKAYQHLDALTFNVLNQTKTLSAALCCYLIMGRRQSKLQIVALLLLLTSALVMEKVVKVNDIVTYLSWDYWKDWSGTSANSTDLESSLLLNATTNATMDLATLPDTTMVHWDMDRLTNGVAPILLASLISGLAGALSQMNLQKAGGGRNAYLFGMELCVASILLLAISLVFSPDGKKILQEGFFHGWTPQTLIPIVTNAIGGTVVGLVTKYAGSVRKGFALIFGILISGLIQAVLHPELGVSKEQILGGILAVISMYMHATNPPVKSIPSGAANVAAAAAAAAAK